MTLKEKLSAIQQEMKAPKNLYNHFGKYKYRNAEGILEAFKPYEGKYKVAMVVRDEIVSIGGWNYVKATAYIIDTESSDELCSSAYAREPEDKKGMDAAQITGTSSSYARKYALNGLLLLDDTKDPDSDENHVETEEKAKQEPEPEPTTLPEPMIKTLEECIPKHDGTVRGVCKYYGVKRLCDMTVEQFKDCMNRMGEQDGKVDR